MFTGVAIATASTSASRSMSPTSSYVLIAGYSLLTVASRSRDWSHTATTVAPSVWLKFLTRFGPQ